MGLGLSLNVRPTMAAPQEEPATRPATSVPAPSLPTPVAAPTPISREETIDIIFDSLRQAKNVEEAGKILRHLSLYADKRALGRLGGLFLDPVAGVEYKREVAKAMFEIGKKGEYLPLVDLFDGDRYTLRGAVEAMLKTQEPLFAESLGSCALDKRHPDDFRALCLLSAATLWDGESKLAPLLKINHLGADAIFQRALDGAGAGVQVKMIRLIALNRLSQFQPYLLNVLRQGGEEARQEAARALGLLASPAALPGLLQVLAPPHSRPLQAAALQAVQRIGGGPAEAGLRRLLRGDDEGARLALLRAFQDVGCGEMGNFLRGERRQLKTPRERALMDGLLAECQGGERRVPAPLR